MRLQAGPEDEGRRLDLFLAEPLGSRSRAQRLIDAGAVTVDGRQAPKRHRLQPGEVVEAQDRDVRPAIAADAEPAPFRVAWEDASLIVVDKPPGVVVHPARGHRTGTLVQSLAGRTAGGEEAERPGIVHRLDRDTSGLLVVARSEDVHRAFAVKLFHHLVKQPVLAYGKGTPEALRQAFAANGFNIF